MSLTLTNSITSSFTPAPEGIHSAVCCDVIDLGIQETQFGAKPMLQIRFELESKQDDGKPFNISKRFTASLNPKSNLAQFLAKWRGAPVKEGETIDLSTLIGRCATLVIGAWERDGKSGTAIDAVSKPTKKLALSGTYDPAATRQRIAEYAAKAGTQAAVPAPSPAPVPAKKPIARQAVPAVEAEDDMPF